MKNHLPFLFILLISIMSCKSNKDLRNQEDHSDNAPEEVYDDNITSVEIVKSYPKDNNAVDIKNVKIDKNIMTLEVEYSGGCEDHNFSLLSNRMMKKSLPPQMVLFLKHDSNNDNCRQLINTKIQFNLSEALFPEMDQYCKFSVTTDGKNYTDQVLMDNREN